jgi:dTDP-4-dehydrorhamnose 3,5-epimerase
MKIIHTKFKDLKLIKTKIFKDQRGFFKEVFKNKVVQNNNFIFDCMSYSKKNVLRGLHFQKKKTTDKIINSCSG